MIVCYTACAKTPIYIRSHSILRPDLQMFYLETLVMTAFIFLSSDVFSTRSA